MIISISKIQGMLVLEYFKWFFSEMVKELDIIRTYCQWHK